MQVCIMNGLKQHKQIYLCNYERTRVCASLSFTASRFLKKKKIPQVSQQVHKLHAFLCLSAWIICYMPKFKKPKLSLFQ